jgi:hypothetical protein
MRLASFDQFLQWLKPLNDSGLINTLGVIIAIATVFVALLPAIWKWKKRPKLAVLLKAVEIKGVIGSHQGGPVISTTARMLVKNVGGSAALNVRAVVKDLYIQTSEPLSFVWRDHGQKTLTSSDKDLPAGLSFPVSLIERYQTISGFDTGFTLGDGPHVSMGAASASGNVGGMLGLDGPLPAGTYIIRFVVSANNAVPTTHLIQMQLAGAIQVRVAKWRERWAVHKADRRATKGEISTG